MKFEVLKLSNLYLIFIYYTWTILLAFNLFSRIDAVLYPYVTCGSVIKLLNQNYELRLHSHEVKYGSGSGQQSVTAVNKQDDINSHWVVKGKNGKMCARGSPIACGDTVRLEHLETHKNLHSHHFSSPLSGNQEVSAYGTDGEGDTGDNWSIVCSSDHWERSSTIRLKHTDTDMWLAVTGHSFGRPITGQKEVVALSYSDSACYWKTAEGVFVKPSDPITPHLTHVHTEL